MSARRNLRAAAPACAAIVFSCAQAWAQVPGEVIDLDWCPGSQDCLVWSPVAGADGYKLYRGGLDGVAGLLSGGAEPCLVGSFAATTSGPLLAAPPPSSGHWYLVAATNAAGEGSAGAGTNGPRVVTAATACEAGGAALTLNEVDYDQAGADTAEFIEIHNAGPGAADLTGVVMIFVNGSNQSEYGRVDLSGAGSLAAGAFAVVGAETVLAALPAGVAGVGLPTSLQNGAPDGIALFDSVAGTLLDALSYEGEIRAATFAGVDGTFDLVEGQPATAVDAGDGSLARLPDGRDTANADADWALVPVPTPGTANVGG